MSDTKIELLSPFKELWRFGYLVTNSENRRNVILYNSNKDRSTVSYARYLMCVSLGRILSEEEHVDHCDEDKTNDILSNLQILTPIENTKKNVRSRVGSVLLVKISCPICGVRFERKKGLTQLVPSLRGKVMACSRRCSGRVTFIPKDLREIISVEQIFGTYREVYPE